MLQAICATGVGWESLRKGGGAGLFLQSQLGVLAGEGDALLGEAVIVDADVLDGAVGGDSGPAGHVFQPCTLQHDGGNAL